MKSAILTKKAFQHFAVVAFVALFMGACTPKEDPKPLGKYDTEGVLMINEGNFSEGNSSLTFLDITTKTTVANALAAENNGEAYKGIIQSIRLYEGNYYVAMQNPARMLIVGAYDLKVKANLTKRLINPIDFAAVGSKGYVANWGKSPFSNSPKSYLLVLDLQNNFSVLDSIPLTQRPEKILAYNGRVYITEGSANKVAIFEPTSKQISKITVADAPYDLVLDANNKIWVLCSSVDYSNFPVVVTVTKLVSLNPANNVVETTLNDYPSGSKMVFNAGFLYSLSGNKVYKVDTNAPQKPTSAFITNTDFSFYGIGVNPRDGTIYAGEYSFTTNSRVYVYDTAGTKTQQYTAGVGTNGFLFTKK